MKILSVLSSLALSIVLTSTAAAQKYTAVYVFGDSNLDTGYYRALANPGSNPTYNGYWPAAVANGAGRPTSSPGLNRSQLLAQYFGGNALPANQAGGTNYATSGAKNQTVNNGQTGGFQAAIPTVTQIANYLSAHSNQADANALYYINSGSNDVAYALGQTGTGPYPPDPNAYLTQATQALATAIKSLQTAGAKTIIVEFTVQSFPMGAGNATERAMRAYYNTQLNATLNSQSVNFTKSDIDSVRLAIFNNPSKYGFTFIGTAAGQPACTIPAGVTTAWALLCSSQAGAPSQFVSANADLTSLFADDSHLATAGQRILANYIYNLIPAPTSSPLVSAVLPASRSIQVGNTATAFATIINSGSSALTNCQFAPVTDFPGRFLYQTTNPATNALSGTPNTPASIPAGGFQTFVMAFTATAAMAGADVKFAYVCGGQPTAVSLLGINTFRLTFDVNPVPDIVALAATPRNDGIMHITGTTGSSAFAVATVNLGIAATVTVKVDNGGAVLPLDLSVCETVPSTGACKNPATPFQTTATIGANATPTFAIFGTARGAIAASPGANRIFVRFSDSNDQVSFGSTSVAVQTE